MVWLRIDADSPVSLIGTDHQKVATLTMRSHQPGNGTRTKSARALMVSVIGIAIVMLGLAFGASMPTAGQIASGPQPCVNGIVPLNPYVVNCNLPPRGNQVVGAAPDAGAIIGCRHNFACLALYVNYPGMLLRSRVSTLTKIPLRIRRPASNLIGQLTSIDAVVVLSAAGQRAGGNCPRCQ